MNAIVEFPRGKLTRVRPPLELQVAELKREVRALKKELKDERRHAVGMLAIMREMVDVPRASLLLRACQCDECTCTPTRSEMLRGR